MSPRAKTPRESAAKASETVGARRIAGGLISAAPESFWFQRLAEAITDAVALVRFGRLVWVNDSMLAVSGRAALADFGDSAFRDLFKDTGSGLPEARDRHSLECGLHRNNGEVCDVTVRLAGLDEEGDTEVWVIEDPSHLRMLESEVLVVSRALHLRNREFADLEEQLRGERADRAEMLNVVSHELRTPVTIIGGYNRLLLSEEVGPLTEDQRRFLVESSRGCRRLNDFIGKLLEDSPTLPSGVLEVGRESLRSAIESVAELMRPLLEDKELTIDLAVAVDADWTQFDRLRIEQILTNIIGNAITHSPTGRTIEVATRRRSPCGDSDRRFLEVSVSDAGPGVPAADRDRIFDAYVQAGGSRRSGSVGLGLAVCKRLVEAHGGTISVSDRPGGGSTFNFTLPEVNSQGSA